MPTSATITLRTCVGLYDYLRPIWPHLFAKAPSEGIDLTVSYSDTAPDSMSRKTIVAVHGNPGNHSHFSQLTSHFAGTDTRVIAPSLPGFEHTRSSGGVFWHTTPEKACFLRDFLAALNVTTVDVLVSHSFGIQTTAQLWQSPDGLEIKSVALLSPNPNWQPDPNAIRFGKFLALRNESWYRFLDWTQIYKLSIWPMKFADINDFLIAASHVFDDRTTEQLKSRLDFLVHQTTLPVTLLYGSHDRLITPFSVKHMYERLGVAERIVTIDPKVTGPDDLPDSGQRIRGYIIKGAGHLAHVKYSGLVNRMIEHLLDRS